MQIVCRCKHCGHRFMNTEDEDLAIEFDFLDEQVIFVCRNKGCKRVNRLSFAKLSKTMPLP